MLVGPAPSTFLALEGGLDDKLCPLIQFWTFAYFSCSFALFFPRGVFQIMKISPSQGSFSISFPLTRMMVKAKWPGLSIYITFFPWFMRKMSFLMNKSVCYLHTHRESPFHWVLSLRVETVHSFEYLCDLIQDTFYHFDPNHLTINSYNNRGLHMNQLLIFGSASVTCSFSSKERDEICLSLGLVWVLP